MTRCLHYARYSSDLQKPTSIDDQFSACMFKTQKEGWTFVGRHYDKAKSGASIIGRAGLLEVMAAAENRQFDLLVVESLDRIARNQADLHYFFQIMEFASIGIFSLEDNCRVDGIHVTLSGFKAADYLKGLGQKIRRGHLALAKKGLFGAGPAPYGYRRDKSEGANPGTLVIFPEEAEIIRRAFREYGAGRSSVEIAKIFNAERLRPPRAALWRSPALLGSRSKGSGILRNELYRGVHKYGRLMSRKNPANGKLVRRVNTELETCRVEVPHLRIIDDEAWKLVQDRLCALAAKPLHARKRFVYLLSGLLACGVCGHKYVMNSGKYRCEGQCGNSCGVEREALETTVLGMLSGALLHPDLIAKYLEEFELSTKSQYAEYQDRDRTKRAKLDALEREMARLLALSAKTEPPATKYLLEAINKLAPELDEARAEEACMPPSPPPILDANTMVELLRTQIRQLREHLGEAGIDASRARDTLRSLITRIVLRPVGSDNDRARDSLSLEIEGEFASLVLLAHASGNRGALLEQLDWFQQCPITWRLSAVIEIPRFIYRRREMEYAQVIPILREGKISVSELLTRLAPHKGSASVKGNRRRLLNWLGRAKARGVVEPFGTRTARKWGLALNN